MSDKLNETGQELADALGMSEDDLLGALSGTQYRLSWMIVDGADLSKTSIDNADGYAYSLSNVYESLYKALRTIVNGRDLSVFQQATGHRDFEQLGQAAGILKDIAADGLVTGMEDDVDVTTTEEADLIRLADRLKRARELVEQTEIHAELSN